MMENVLLGTALDATGFSGAIFTSSLFLALFGSTLLVFIHLWRKGRLDMDEEAKYQLFDENEKTTRKE